MALPEPERAAALLRRRDFRRTYLAVVVSDLGDAFQYIALMWFALEAGGPLGVVAVRLADSVPALLFGFHGGAVADRFDRKRTMVAADLLRVAVLVPIAIAERPRIREGFAALRPFPMLVAVVGVLAVAVTISSGTWIVGVPELVRSELGRGAAAFSLVAAGYALGSITAGVALTRIAVARKAEGSILAWGAYLPGYLVFAVADSVEVAIAGSVLVGLGQGTAWVLANSAAQEQVPDHVLGRVMGLISLVHRGAHATGVLFVAPLFAVVEPQVVFAVAAITIPMSALSGLVIASRRAGAARAVA